MHNFYLICKLIMALNIDPVIATQSRIVYEFP